MRPYSGGPTAPRMSGGSFSSIASRMREPTRARRSSSYGGGTSSRRTPAARAASAVVSGSRGVAARGSKPSRSMVTSKAAPEAPMSQSYSAFVAVASAAGKLHSRPAPDCSGGMSRSSFVRSGASDGQLGDHERRAAQARRAEAQVVGDAGDRRQQRREVAGDRDALHRIAALAVLEVVARRPERELARDGVDRVEVEQRRDPERAVQAGHERFGARGPRGEVEVGRADAARRRVRAAP